MIRRSKSSLGGPCCRWRVLAIAASLSWLVFGGVGCASTTAANLGPAVTNSDLALGFARPDNRDAGMFSETFRMLATLDGGGKIYMRLLVSNVGPGDHKASFQLIVSLPGKPSQRIGLRLKKGQWTAGADRLDIKLGKTVTIEGDLGHTRRANPNITVKVEHAAADVTLRVNSSMFPFRPRGGNVDFGNGRYYSTLILVPHGSIEGTVAYKTGDAAGQSASFKGHAFVENRGSNVAPHTLSRSSLSAVDVTAEGTFCMVGLEKTAQLGKGWQAWMYRTVDEKMQVVMQEADVALLEGQRDLGSGYEVPRVVKFTDRAPTVGQPLQAILQGTTLEKSTDDLGKLSRIERFFVERFAKPWSFRFKAKYLVAVPKAGGGDERFTGNAPYVFQQLNP